MIFTGIILHAAFYFKRNNSLERLMKIWSNPLLHTTLVSNYARNRLSSPHGTFSFDRLLSAVIEAEGV
jgi:hypothetical protein